MQELEGVGFGIFGLISSLVSGILSSILATYIYDRMNDQQRQSDAALKERRKAANDDVLKFLQIWLARGDLPGTTDLRLYRNGSARENAISPSDLMSLDEVVERLYKSAHDKIYTSKDALAENDAARIVSWYDDLKKDPLAEQLLASKAAVGSNNSGENIHGPLIFAIAILVALNTVFIAFVLRSVSIDLGLRVLSALLFWHLIVVGTLPFVINKIRLHRKRSFD
jgi:hypothetical protein